MYPSFEWIDSRMVKCDFKIASGWDDAINVWQAAFTIHNSQLELLNISHYELYYELWSCQRLHFTFSSILFSQKRITKWWR